MNKFCIGLFVAAFVCGIMLICGATAEASMLGSISEIQCTAAPSLITHPFINFVMLVITLAALFL